MSSKQQEGQPTKVPDGKNRVILPMTSIAGRPETTSEDEPLIFYLTVANEQANIALHNLLSIWALEGQSGDRTIWLDRSKFDEITVWSNLQGALFAGIVLARMLYPQVRNPGMNATPSRKKVYEARCEVADRRARRLRALLGVDLDSPIIRIRRVRDAIEHFDERIDSAVMAGDIASVSDFTISPGGKFGEPVTDSPTSSPPASPKAKRHITLRQFSPDHGTLWFGDECIDLFALEAALHSLIAMCPAAFESVANELPPGAMYGGAQLLSWNAGDIDQRREEIAILRQKVKMSGHWSLRPESRPRTVYMAFESNPS